MLLIFIVNSVILIVLFFKKDDIMAIDKVNGRIEKKGFAEFQFEEKDGLIHIKNVKHPFFSLFSCCVPSKRNKLEQCFASPMVFKQIKEPQNKTYQALVAELNQVASKTLASNLERQKKLATQLGDTTRNAAYLKAPMRAQFEASCDKVFQSLLLLSSIDWNVPVTQKKRTERLHHLGNKLGHIEGELTVLDEQFKRFLWQTHQEHLGETLSPDSWISFMQKTDEERLAMVEQAKNRQTGTPVALVFPSTPEPQPVSLEPVIVSIEPLPIEVIELEQETSSSLAPEKNEASIEDLQPLPVIITEPEPAMSENSDNPVEISPSTVEELAEPAPVPTVSEELIAEENTEPTVVLCPIDELTPVQPFVLDPAIVAGSLEDLYKTCVTSLGLLAGSLPDAEERKTLETMLPGWIYQGSNPSIGAILEILDSHALENTFAQTGAVEIRQAIARTEATWIALNAACDAEHSVAFSDNHPYHAFPLYSLRDLISKHVTHNPKTLTEAIDGMKLLNLKQVKGAWKGQVQSIISQLQNQPNIREKVENYFALMAKAEHQIALWNQQEPYQFDRARSLAALLNEAQSFWEPTRSKSFMQVEGLIDIYTPQIEEEISAEPRPLTLQLAALDPSASEYGQLRRLVVEEKAQQLRQVIEQLSPLKIDKKHISKWDKTIEELKKCQEIAENPEFLERIDSPQFFLRQSEKHLDAIFKMVESHLKDKIVARWQPYQATIKLLKNLPSKERFDLWKQNLEGVLEQGKSQGRYEQVFAEMNKISKASAPKRFLNEVMVPNLNLEKIVSDSLFISKNQPWQPALQEIFEECLTELRGQISDCKSLAQHREWFAKFDAFTGLMRNIGFSAQNSAKLLSHLIPNYAEALLAINPVAGKREEYQALKTHLQNQTKGVWPFKSSSIKTMADVQALDVSLEAIKTLKGYGYLYQKVLNTLMATLPETLRALAKECHGLSLDYQHLIFEEAQIRTMNVSELSALATTIDQTYQTLADVREVIELEKDFFTALEMAQHRIFSWSQEDAAPYRRKIQEIKSEYDSMRVTGWMLSFFKNDTYSRMGEFYKNAIEELAK